MHLSCLPYLPHAPPVLFFLISPPTLYLVRITRYEVPNCTIVFQSPVTLSLSCPSIFLRILLSNILGLSSSLSVRNQISYPCKTTGNITVTYIVIFMFCESEREDKRFWTEWKQTFPEFCLLPTSQRKQFWFVGIVTNYLNSATLGLITYLYVVILSCLLFHRYDLNT